MIKPIRSTGIRISYFLMLAGGPLSVPAKDPGSVEPVPSASPVLVAEHHLMGQDFKVTQVILWDRTDRNDELVRLTEHPLADAEKKAFIGSIFVVQNTSNQEGLIFVRQSPMPNSRPVMPERDIEVEKNPDGLTARLYRAGYEPAKDLWHVISFKGGAYERIRAIQSWQRSLRPDTPLFRIPKFITNTWGDRSRDARISEAFIIKEIEAAREIGADVVRIDDGWQTGLSGNSAFKGKMKTKGLTGFWDVSDAFWQVNRERFPNGLKPVLEKAKEAGVEIGLWYAPDSDHELANWEKDAGTILELHKAHGVRCIKLDGLNVETPLAQERVNQLLSTITKKSNYEILPMLDITGGHKRPGFLGAIPYGNLYVQNRYTDWGNYWPHRTLRSLWRLSHWVDPMRLRFETLNNTRNADHKKYKNNPLAPVNYPADYLFASVMMSNPLGFYEASNLPEDYRAKLTPLVKVWRQHREALSKSCIIPIGQEPSGHSWTGFMTVNLNIHYLLFLRERTEKDSHTYRLPLALDPTCKLEFLHGRGTATAKGDTLTVSIKEPFGYLFMKVR